MPRTFHCNDLPRSAIHLSGYHTMDHLLALDRTYIAHATLELFLDPHEDVHESNFHDELRIVDFIGGGLRPHEIECIIDLPTRKAQLQQWLVYINARLVDLTGVSLFDFNESPFDVKLTDLLSRILSEHPQALAPITPAMHAH